MVRTSQITAALIALSATACGSTALNMSPIGGSWYVYKPGALIIEAGHQQQMLYREWKGSRVRVAEDAVAHHYYGSVDCLLWKSIIGGPHIIYAGCRDRAVIVVVTMEDLEDWKMESRGLTRVQNDRVSADGTPIRPTLIFTAEAIAADAATQPEFAPEAMAVVTDLAPREETVVVNVNDVDIIGRTALHNAAGWLEPEDPLPLVNALIEHGADVNAVDKYGFTALMIAAEKTHADVVARLIEAGASVLARNKGNETALMKAAGAIDHQVEMVTMLLRAGADKSVRDQYGRTAFDAIRSNTDPQLKVLLAVQ